MSVGISMSPEEIAMRGIETSSSQGVTSQAVGSTIVEPWLKPPLPPPPAPNPLVAIAEGALPLLLPVAAFAGTFFGSADAAGDANESKAVQNFNTGYKTSVIAEVNPRGFEGGQIAGVDYLVDCSWDVTINGVFQYRVSHNQYPAVGKIVAAKIFINDYSVYIQITDGNGDRYIRATSGNSGEACSASNGSVSILRADGLPIDTTPTTTKNSPSGYTGSDNDPNPKRLLPPNLSATIRWGNTKPLPPSLSLPALGLGSSKSKAPSDLLPPKDPKAPPLASPPQSPVQNPASSPPIQKPTPPLDKPKAPFDPLKPYTPNPNDLTGQIASIGAILGTINANTTDIKNNTTPENQQFNAKTGSCQAMNSPSCTQGFEDRIKNPLSDKLDAAQIARDTGQAYEVAQFSAIADNFTKVKTFLDNTIVDRAIGVANFAMNVHNALMLSNALGKTLAGVVDNAMNAAHFEFTNTAGQRTTASQWFSSSVSSVIVNLIGQDLYTELTDDWKVANRIYQSGTNLLNKTERLLSGQSKIAQKSGIDVANIGNALRANGIVNPNSYPPMAATKEANTPTELLADVNTPLASIQASVKNLNSITKDIAGTVKQVSGIQKEFGKLADLTNKESKVRKSLRTQSANQAKVKAKFTLLQIKQIKASGQK
jgi:hypothetical protein